MVKQVVWSLQAQLDRKEILNYWRHRNKSNFYSKKLNQSFIESVKMIANFPQIGKNTDSMGVRVKVVRDYLIIYEETEIRILILTIWNSRQDPEKLKRILE